VKHFTRSFVSSRRLFWLSVLVSLISVCSPQAHALSTEFTAQQLIDFLNTYRTSSDPSKRSLAADLQQKFADVGITLSDNGFLISGQVPTVGGDLLSCNDLRSAALIGVSPGVGPLSGDAGASWSVFLDGAATKLGLLLANSGNFGVSVNLGGTVSGDTSANLHWYQGYIYPGVKCNLLGCFPDPQWRCEHAYDQELLGITLNGSFNIRLALTLDASLEQNNSGRYQIVLGRQALAGASGPLTGTSSVNADVELSGDLVADGVLWNLLVDHYVEPSISDNAKSAIADRVSEKNGQIRSRLPVTYQLPDVHPVLVRLIGEILGSPILHDYVQQHFQEIVFYLLINDVQSLEQSLRSAAACDATRLLRANMSMPSVYVNNQGSCVAANVEGADAGAYFSDSSCTRQIAFRPTPYVDYCSEVLGFKPNTRVGNAANWSPDFGQPGDPLPDVPSQRWTVTPGTQFAITTEKITGKTAPFMKRVRYRDIVKASDGSVCSLEMRVYKKDVNATGLMPLLAIHGGSWQFRGAAFMGLEAQISHYTDQGFIVFAPFYRLARDADGNPECNGAAWFEITADAEAALDWVKQNGVAFGARPGNPAVMGQSAGAHLSGWLLTHRPADVTAGLLLYPPTDIGYLLTQYRAGQLDKAHEPSLDIERSLDILSNFFGTQVRSADINADFIQQNSFAQYVRNGGIPPALILQGRQDEIVPSSQAVFLCNAYGGNAVNNGGAALLRAIYPCGASGSQLVLFEQSQHGLDGCIADVPGLCLAGNSSSRRVVADTLRQARSWLQSPASTPLNVMPAVDWLVPILELLFSD
jgi:acetyl esterase/lipase